MIKNDYCPNCGNKDSVECKLIEGGVIWIKCKKCGKVHLLKCRDSVFYIKELDEKEWRIFI